MTRTIDLNITDETLIGLRPLSLRPDGDDVIVGRTGGRYLALSPAAADMLHLLDGRTPLRVVRRHMQVRYGADAGTVAAVLETLLVADFVTAIDGEPVGGHDEPARARRTLLTRSRVAWLFGWTATAVYALLVATASLVAIARPGAVPGPADVLRLGHHGAAALLTFAVALLALVKHEAAHVAAARFLGVDARWRLRRRLYFPIIATDLSDLWLVDRRRRYLAFAAGMISDVVALAAIIIIVWLGERGTVPLAGAAIKAARLTGFVLVCMVLWQLNICLKSDLYYILTNAAGTRNLDADARAYLRSLARLRPRSASAPAPAAIRLYALALVITTAIWIAIGAVWLGRLVMLLEAQSVGAAPAAAGFLITIGLAACAHLAERRRAQVRYRLHLSPGA